MSRILSCNEPDLERDSNYILIRGMIESFHKLGENRNWNEFRAALEKKEKYDPVWPLWEEIQSECYRNGFMAPYVSDNKIRWRQVRTSGEYHSLDLCTMCERECDRREKINTGKEKWMRQNLTKYKEKKACWEKVAYANS